MPLREDLRMILCFMQFPPSPHGHGGSQRAYYLLKGLIALGPVHLVLISGAKDHNSEEEDRLATFGVQTVTRVVLPEWVPSWHRWRRIPRRAGRWIDVVRMRSVYAPRFSKQVISRIAAQLPIDQADVVFAGRLPAACIVDALVRQKLLSMKIKVVDFDDVQSRLEQREGRAEQRWFALDRAIMSRLQALVIKKVEADVASRWDAVSVCSDEDVALLSNESPDARVFRVPNVIDKPLRARNLQTRFSILFVGNLAFGPNRLGLELFVRQCWPRLRVAQGDDLVMTVVGLHPPEPLRALLNAAGILLRENVPAVDPYYEQADAVIAPILFGSGTRVKILEAMAFGVPVVSTTIGAEGLSVQPGRHALIADDMEQFAACLLDLAKDPGLRSRLAVEGRSLQQEQFSPPAMRRALQAMVTPRL